jgi:hypothetical protein
VVVFPDPVAPATGTGPLEVLINSSVVQRGAGLIRTPREKLIKIGAKVIRHSRRVVFQVTEVAVSRDLFAEILFRIGQLRANPDLVSVTRLVGRQRS